MKQKESLFSDFFVLLWHIALACCLATGAMHLFGRSELPEFAVNWPVMRLHCFSVSLLLCLSVYAAIVFVMCKARFMLTKTGFLDLILCALVCCFGLALTADGHGLINITGIGHFVFKACHLLAGFCLTLRCLVGLFLPYKRVQLRDY